MENSRLLNQFNWLLMLWKQTGSGKVPGKAGGIELAREHYLAILEDEKAKPRMIIVAQLMLGDIEIASIDDAKAREYYLSAFNPVLDPEDEWQKAVNDVVLHRFIKKRNYDDALTVHKSHPGYGYLRQLGDWLRSQGRGFEMVELYEDYVLSGDVKLEEAYAFGLGDYGLACNVLDKLVQVAQGEQLAEKFAVLTADLKANPRLYRNYAYLLFKMGRSEESLQQIEAYLSVLNAPTVTDYRLAGDLCAKSNMIDEAIACYEMARNTEETDREVLRRSMYSQRLAMPGYWKSMSKIRTLETLGNLYMKADSLSDAEACFKEIVELQSTHKDANAEANLAKIWERTEKENIFVDELKTKVDADTANGKLRVEYAETLSKAGKLDQAVKQFAKAVELSGNDLSVQLKYADALAKNKQNAKAIAEYEKVFFAGIKMESDRFARGKGGDRTEPRSVLYRLVKFCKRIGEDDKALEIYGQVLKSVDLPDTRWKPDEHMIERILKGITEILDAKGDYDGVVRIWLDYRSEMGRFSRYKISDRFEYLNPEPIAKYVDELKTTAPNDYVGKFILADMLAYQNRDKEAMEIYTVLLADAPVDLRIDHDLVRIFQRAKNYDLSLMALKKGMTRFNAGSRDAGRQWENIAEMYIKLGDKEKAAESYRKAISCDVSKTEYQQYQRELFKATDGKEGIVKFEQVEDLDAMRRRAGDLLNNEKYTEAIELYEKILKKASTGIESMSCMGEAYQKLGNIAKATEIFEKVVFDKDIRVWANGSYYSADSCLESIYRQSKDIKKQVTLFALTDRGNFSEIKSRLKSPEDFEEFHKCLIEQYEQTPKNIKLRLYLTQYFFKRGDLSKANRIVKQLKADLTDDKGVIADPRNAVRLAATYETLGQFDEALAVFPVAYCKDNARRYDYMGKVLMRLYAKAGQFDKTLDICRQRLKADISLYRTVEIAEELAKLAHIHSDGYDMLNRFMEDVKVEMLTRNYKRFSGAIKAYLAAHPAEKVSKADTTDIVSLLKDGRKVETPNKCRSFADFLEKLAYQADTIAIGSFMGSHGDRIKPPRFDLSSGSVFGILAAAIDGKDVDMHITQNGYWEFNYSGDETRRIRYVGKGGFLCKFKESIRRSEREYISFRPHIFFDPIVGRNVVSVQWMAEVEEAVDDKGRNMPIPQIKIRWGLARNLEVNLGKQQSPAKSIKKLRVKTAVAVAAKWATFKVDRMDHDKPIILENSTVISSYCLISC